MTTNPIAEQNAVDEKDGYNYSNGLLKDTCKHIRYVRSQEFSSSHLSGILIDTFVYRAIKDWHWIRNGEVGSGQPSGTYEQRLLDYYNRFIYNDYCSPSLYAPGSNMLVSSGKDWGVLGKVLKKMV